MTEDYIGLWHLICFDSLFTSAQIRKLLVEKKSRSSSTFSLIVVVATFVEMFFLNFFYPHFYLQTVQMQVHLANGVMRGEAGRAVPISTLYN
jgi:hypothetical protein